MLLFSLADREGERPDALYEACLLRLAQGERDALHTLYEGTRSAVYGFALSMVQNRQDAEDVLQDTFVSIYASAAGYRPMGKPLAWILTITRNLALMKLRGRKATRDISEDAWGRFAARESMDAAEDNLVLTTALQSLKAEESQIVMLHAVAGFKHREIASLLELPLSTVLSKYSRAIRKLKTILKEGEARG